MMLILSMLRTVLPENLILAQTIVAKDGDAAHQDFGGEREQTELADQHPKAAGFHRKRQKPRGGKREQFTHQIPGGAEYPDAAQGIGNQHGPAPREAVGDQEIDTRREQAAIKRIVDCRGHAAGQDISDEFSFLLDVFFLPS